MLGDSAWSDIVRFVITIIIQKHSLAGANFFLFKGETLPLKRIHFAAPPFITATPPIWVASQQSPGVVSIGGRQCGCRLPRRDGGGLWDGCGRRAERLYVVRHDGLFGMFF